MISVGSIVREKGGLVKMTVTAVEGGKAECTWFDTRNRMKRKTFPIDRLEIVPTRR